MRITTLFSFLLLTVVLLNQGCVNPWVKEVSSSTVPPYYDVANTVKTATPSNSQQSVVTNTNVYVSFTRPMIKSTAESSFVLSPPTNGTFRWTDDQTLVFDPKENLMSDTTYTITVTVNALDIYNNPLESQFSSTFTTVSGPPSVYTTTPANGAKDVSVNSALRITFSEPVDQTSAASGFSSNPSMTIQTTTFDGDSTLVVTPSTALLTNTTYTIVIATTVKDLQGNYMEKSYEFSFTTASSYETTKPQILSVKGIDEEYVAVQFSEPVEKTSAETTSNYAFSNGQYALSASLISSTPYFSYKESVQEKIKLLQKDYPGNDLVILKTLPQLESEVLTVTISNIRDLNGNLIDNQTSRKFVSVVKPTLIRAIAISSGTLELTFSEPVGSATANIKENYIITPDLSISNAVLYNGYSYSDKVRLTTTTQGNGQKYTITVVNVKDKNGNDMGPNNNKMFLGIQ